MRFRDDALRVAFSRRLRPGLPPHQSVAKCRMQIAAFWASQRAKALSINNIFIAGCFWRILATVADIKAIAARYEALKPFLDERTRRLMAADLQLRSTARAQSPRGPPPPRRSRLVDPRPIGRRRVEPWAHRSRRGSRQRARYVGWGSRKLSGAAEDIPQVLGDRPPGWSRPHRAGA